MSDNTSNKPSNLKNKPYVEMTFWESMEFNRLFVSIMLVLVVVMAGAFAAGFGAWNSTIEIGLVMTPAMAVLVCNLSVLPMRYLIYASIISLAMDILVMVI